MMAESEPSYIDYEAFLDPNFSPTSFANSLVTLTNNPSDTPLDLNTPLSRVLFDVQEIDTHIDTLTTKSAIPLLTYTKDQADASQRIVAEVEAQVASLTDGYQRLEKDVIQRHEAAEQVSIVVERLWQTVKIGRAVARCLLLSRQLEVQIAEVGSRTGARKEDHRAMVRASNSLLTLRQILSASGSNEEGQQLSQVHLITSLQRFVIAPSENNLRDLAQQIIREFSMSSLSSSSSPTTSTLPTYNQTEETKSRTTSALLTLYLLSPAPTSTEMSQPSLLLSALQSYLRTALTSSLASLARALATLPTLDRTLIEVSARCQNIVALETLLENVKPPPHPLLAISAHPRHLLTTITHAGQPDQKNPPVDGPPAVPENLLQPLLGALDTASLPSYFWRSLAEGLASRVAELVARGGVSARTLKSQRDRVRESIRDCVIRGSQGPGGKEGGWEREAAVMVGSVVGSLGR